jgi:hypothetical protein
MILKYLFDSLALEILEQRPGSLQENQFLSQQGNFNIFGSCCRFFQNQAIIYAIPEIMKAFRLDPQGIFPVRVTYIYPLFQFSGIFQKTCHGRKAGCHRMAAGWVRRIWRERNSAIFFKFRFYVIISKPFSHLIVFNQN